MRLISLVPALAAAVAVTATQPAVASPIKGLDVEVVESANVRGMKNQDTGWLVYRGGVKLEAPGDSRFGGYSSLYVDGETNTFVSVSDVAYRMTGRLVFDDKGNLAGLDAVDLEPLLDENGVRLEGKSNRDAEAITPDGEGGLLVAFERNHRILRYGRLAAGNAQPFPTPQGLIDAPPNGGAEAMTRLSDGRLMLMTEDYKGEQTGMRRAWVGKEGRWIDFQYVVFDGYEPVDAALGPEGRYVYVLERKYRQILGGEIRIRRFLERELRSGARVVGDVVGELGYFQVTDNFEGLSVVARPGGGVRLYLISDDNFEPLQDTYLFAFDVEKP